MPSVHLHTREGRRKRISTTGIDRQASGEDQREDLALPIPWRSLFYHTTKHSIPVLVFSIVISIVSGAVGPAGSYLNGKIFEALVSYAAGTLDESALMDHEKKYISYLVGLAGISWLCHSIELTCWLAFGELQANTARNRLFVDMLAKEIEWYDLRENGIGALIPRLQAQIRDLELATSQPLGCLASATVLNLAEALYFSWTLTLVTLATAPLIIVGMAWLGSGVQSQIAKQQDKLNEALKYITDAFTGIETVKCFNGQDSEMRKYTGTVQQAASRYRRQANLVAIQMGLVVFLSGSMFVQGFYYGGILIHNGEKTPGDVVTTFLSAIGAFQALQAILPQMIVLERGKNAGASLRAVMTHTLRGKNTQRASTPDTFRGDINVKNLSFAYPSRPDRFALAGMTMFIPRGKMTFLIGKSGSGKSTLCQLLMRFYQPSPPSSITIDDIPLEQLDVSWLRDNITLVEQTSVLFHDTIFRNLAFGRKDCENVTKQQAMDAAKFALLQRMITNLPHGLETKISYRGASMSGGQRQRMALARARLRDTPILLLDESTCALDGINRTLMMDAIRHWRKGKTTVIITHDISQILSDDYLYLLEHGKLVQEGYRKHLEKMHDTPFQSFLPQELRATASPTDLHEWNKRESPWTNDSSIDYLLESSNPEFLSPGHLDAQLPVDEIKTPCSVNTIDRRSIPRPTKDGVGKEESITSPWQQIDVSPSYAYETTSAPGDRHDDQRMSFTQSDCASPSDSTNGRWPQPLEHLADKNVELDAEARLITSGRERTDSYVSPMSSQAMKSTFSTDNASVATLAQIAGTILAQLDWARTTLLILGFWGVAVHAIGIPVFAFVFSKLLQTYAVADGDKNKALIYSMCILAIAVTDGLHSYIYRFFLEYTAQCWVDTIRTRAVERILDQPRAFFDKDENAVPRLTEALDSNAEEMRSLLSRFATLAFVPLTVGTISIIWALVASWQISLLAIAVAPYIYGTTHAFAAISIKWECLQSAASEKASAIFAETFTNIKTVRALTLESHFSSKYTAATNDALVVGFQRSLYVGFFYGLSGSAGTLATALIFYAGTWLVATKSLPVARVVQVFVVLMFAIQQASAAFEYIPQINSAQNAASRLLRLTMLPRDSHEHMGNTRILKLGPIVFDGLCFAYPSNPEKIILRRVDTCIQPGTSTAIVGGSGSGKSTLVNLLQKFYSTPQTQSLSTGKAGDLSIAGRNINQIHTPSLRGLIALVSQTPTLFAATVAENIAYGLPDESPLKALPSVAFAARQAGIHDFIESLPAGYNTAIGEGGIGLSGGQGQQIAIARALVRNPSLVIFDEATSALDVESANLVRNTITSLVNDPLRALTLIIITHSREMMEIAENIVVLEQGCVVETGSFKELSTRNGALKNLLRGGKCHEEHIAISD